MGTIYKNSIEYGGGGGNTESVELTQAEYDALSDAEKLDGTIYFIKDGNNVPVSDTGWISLQEGFTYRAKNGIVYIRFTLDQSTIPTSVPTDPSGRWWNINSSNPLPEDFRPDTNLTGKIGLARKTTDQTDDYFQVQALNDGTIQTYVKDLTLELNPTNYNTFAFTLSYPQKTMNNTNYTPADVYMTTERVVGQWIDGRPLYQKTIDTGAMPSTLSGTTYYKAVAHNIADMDFVTSVEGFAIKTDYTVCVFPYILVRADNNNASGWSAYATRSEIRIQANANHSDTYTKTYITIKYVKV